jgi:hypothetical protein
MTFGYNSVLFETRSDDRLQDWADYLLDALELIRSGNSDSHHPIVLVCHSLGGLVARKAMIRLSESKGKKYKHISLSSCALLFLSTPHSGTTEADYNEFLTDILARLSGLRKTSIVAELQSFNKSNVDATESFKYMDTQPSFSCLCESSRTKVGGQYRLVSLPTIFCHFHSNDSWQVVPQASAGFVGQTAAKVPETDHHTICKFDTKLDQGYQAILKCLKGLVAQLLVGEANQTENV